MVDDLPYTCEGCKDTQMFRRSQRIAFGPDIVCVQLKRFEWGINGPAKNSTTVAIHQELDLTPHRVLGLENKDMKYDLLAIVKHSGTTTAGHYTCAVKRPDDQWIGFNDHQMTPINAQKALGNSRDTPYLLFYQRRET